MQLHQKFWLIGDSNAWHIKPYLVELAAKDAIRLEGFPVFRSSIVSWSYQHSKEIGLLKSYRPSVVIVCMGLKDISMGISFVKNESRHLEKMVRRICAPMIWVGPPMYDNAEIVDAYSEMIRKACIPYLDSREIKIELWEDRQHPTSKGRQTWAEWIWPRVMIFANTYKEM